jgi:hypothetical protein
MLYAHRVSWELHRGPIPAGLHVLHNCPDGDNPRCVNPAHLYLGTQADNSRDAYAKGQNPGRGSAAGILNPAATVTEAQVRAIRKRYADGDCSYRSLAIEFGTSKTVVCFIIKRRTWKHLD